MIVRDKKVTQRENEIDSQRKGQRKIIVRNELLKKEREKEKEGERNRQKKRQ